MNPLDWLIHTFKHLLFHLNFQNIHKLNRGHLKGGFYIYVTGNMMDKTNVLPYFKVDISHCLEHSMPLL